MSPGSTASGAPSYAILVQAAIDAGAELWEGFTVTEVLFDGHRVVGVRGRSPRDSDAVVTGRLVVGADGLHSLVAGAVEAPRYAEQPPLTYSCYAYWSGVAIEGARNRSRERRALCAYPTNDELACIGVQWPAAEASSFRMDAEGNYLATIGLDAELAEKVRSGARVSSLMAKVAPKLHKDEVFHSTLGIRNLRQVCTTPDGMAEANEKLKTWWPAALDMFGRSDSTSSDDYVKWGLRQKNNAQLRQQYIADTIPSWRTSAWRSPTSASTGASCEAMSASSEHAALVGLAFRMFRPDDRVALLEVTSPNHQEFFLVAEGDRSLSVTVLDVTNAEHPEPRVYVVEKPSGWRTPDRAEDLILSLWSTVLTG